MRLASRFALVMTAAIAFLVVGISFTLIQSETRRLEAEMERQAVILTESITMGINSATFLDKRSLLVDYFDQLIPASGGRILYVLVTDLDNYAWLDTRREHEYEILKDPVSEEIRKRLTRETRVLLRHRPPGLGEALEVGGRITGNGMERGILRIGFSLKPLKDSIHRAILQAILIGLISLAAGIFLSLYLARGVARPIARVVDYARQVAEGRLSAKIPGRSQTREMVELKASIETMKRDLKYIYIGGLFRDFSHAIKGDLGFLYSEIERLKGDESAVRGLRERLDRITDTIEKFKNFQKPSDFLPRPIELGEWIARFVDKLPLDQRGSLSLEISKNLPPIKGDPVYLERALAHLIKNALEAISGVNNPAVSLAASQENGQLVIRVSDKGVGIRKEDLDRVFEAGFTTKRRKPENQAQGAVEGEAPSGFAGGGGDASPHEVGEGMGLALTKMIVEDLHGGTVQVISREGEGTTVSLGFPV